MEAQPSPAQAAIAATETRCCPACAAPLPAPSGFVDWCDRCNWNLDPSKGRSEPLQGLAYIYERLGRRLGRSLFDAVGAEADLRPRLSRSTRIAIVLSTLVYLAAAALAAAGIWLAIVGWPNLFAGVGALVLLASAWFARPRFVKPPEEMLDRGRWPALYAFADRVADEAGAQRIAGIVITPDFNAAITQASWSGQRYLHLGLPLLAVLTPQERIALLAHEFAHGVNGDPARSRYISSAVQTLLYWVYLIRPEEIWPSSDRAPAGPLVAILMIPLNLVAFAVSEGLLWSCHLLVALLYRDSQRAEYYADLLAARVSGAQAMTSALGKLYLADSAQWVVHRYANFRKPDEDLFGNLRCYVQDIPARELERLRRLSAQGESSVDATHPPTAYRTRIIEQRGETDARLELATEEATRVDDELRTFEASITKQLVESHDESLWR